MADTTVTAVAPTKSNMIGWVLGIASLGVIIFIAGYAWQKGQKAGS